MSARNDEPDRRIALERLLIGLPDQLGRHVGMIEPLRHAMHDRGFERVVMQDGRIDEGRELGLAPHGLLGLVADARPNRIDLVERVCGSCVSLRHDRLQQLASRGNSTISAQPNRIWRQKADAPEGYRTILSGPLSQEVEHALLEHLVAHRQHVVAARNIERPPLRQQRGQLGRRARDVVLGADRDQHRHA